MQEKEQKKEQRLAVNVPTEIHRQLKYIALVRNSSMRKIVLRALIAYIKYEEKFN